MTVWRELLGTRLDLGHCPPRGYLVYTVSLNGENLCVFKCEGVWNVGHEAQQ